MNRRRLVPTVLLIAFAALMALAGTASAETKVGEYVGAPNSGVPAEANVLGATAEYDSTTGSLRVTVTTAAVPQAQIEGKPSGIQLNVGLATLPACSLASLVPAAGYPVFELEDHYAEPLALAITAESQKEDETRDPSILSAATKTVEGTKTTLTAQSPRAIGKPYNCVVVGVLDSGTPQEFDLFPLTVKPEPPATETKTAAGAPETKPAPPALAPPPAALSIAKAKKPLKLKVGKWKTVKVKVSDTGGAPTGLGSLRVKAPAGVLVKPEKQKLPILAPGGFWTLPVRVQLTAKAKKTSTLSLVGAAGTLSAKSSLVLKLLGG
ncbi:MAG TPA: hypothetical protein VJ204_10040 [Solirubrobacterales bacterium]|nr:hypothetical protein [Solirubrobacterales bacterium]